MQCQELGSHGMTAPELTSAISVSQCLVEDDVSLAMETEASKADRGNTESTTLQSSVAKKTTSSSRRVRVLDGDECAEQITYNEQGRPRAISSAVSVSLATRPRIQLSSTVADEERGMGKLDTDMKDTRSSKADKTIPLHVEYWKGDPQYGSGLALCIPNTMTSWKNRRRLHYKLDYTPPFVVNEEVISRPAETMLVSLHAGTCKPFFLSGVWRSDACESDKDKTALDRLHFFRDNDCCTVPRYPSSVSDVWSQLGRHVWQC